MPVAVQHKRERFLNCDIMCVANTIQALPVSTSDDESDLDMRDLSSLQSWPSPQQVTIRIAKLI